VVEAIAKLGVSGGVGALIGIVAVWWIDPTTTGGTVLLMAVFIVVSMVVGGLISGRKEQPDGKAQ
jgi:hypothetical protein